MYQKHDIPIFYLGRWQKLVDLIAAIYDVPASLVMRVAPTKIEVLVTSETEENPYEVHEMADLGTGLYCETVMKTRAQLFVPNALEDAEWKDNPDVQLNMINYLGVPLIWPDGSIFGTLCILDTETRQYPEPYKKLLWHLKEIIEGDFNNFWYSQELEEANAKLEARVKRRTLELEEVNAELKARLVKNKDLEVTLREQALRDPLTGLFNRRYMEEALQDELEKATRQKKHLSIVMIDLDNLKKINDLHGHFIGGDKALQALADKIQPLCRKGDIFCRYAGDEFVIILNDTSLQVAYKRTQEWREVIAKVVLSDGDDEFGFTFSAGISEYPTYGKTGDRLIQQADEALYEAKKQGRNRVGVVQIFGKE